MSFKVKVCFRYKIIILDHLGFGEALFAGPLQSIVNFFVPPDRRCEAIRFFTACVFNVFSGNV